MFTAYWQQSVLSSEVGSNDGKELTVSQSWYPTIFFHDLNRNQVVWEVFGAEQFIDIDKYRRVRVLTCEIWTEISREQYDEEKGKRDKFSRHEDYDDYVWRIAYKTYPERWAEREEQAPQVKKLNSYKLSFGKNKDLEITENVKLVEAYFHKSE